MRSCEKKTQRYQAIREVSRQQRNKRGRMTQTDEPVPKFAPAPWHVLLGAGIRRRLLFRETEASCQQARERILRASYSVTT